MIQISALDSGASCTSSFYYDPSLVAATLQVSGRKWLRIFVSFELMGAQRLIKERGFCINVSRSKERAEASNRDPPSHTRSPDVCDLREGIKIEEIFENLDETIVPPENSSDKPSSNAR